MADIQSQPSAGDDDAGVETGSLAPRDSILYIQCTCARCVTRLIYDPTVLCLLQPPSRRGTSVQADTKCTYCHAQRARCYKCPSALKPEILELQQRANDYITWLYGQSMLPPALRSAWVLPQRVGARCPDGAPQVYQELYRAHRVVKKGISRAQKGIPGWKEMTQIERNKLLRLDPVVRDGGDHGYWW